MVSPPRRRRSRWIPVRWHLRDELPGVPRSVWRRLFVDLPRLWSAMPVGWCIALLAGEALAITIVPPPSAAWKSAAIACGTLLILSEMAAVSRDHKHDRRRFRKMMRRFAEMNRQLVILNAARAEDAALSAHGVPAEDPHRQRLAETAAVSMAYIQGMSPMYPPRVRTGTIFRTSLRMPDGTIIDSPEAMPIDPEPPKRAKRRKRRR